MYRKSYFNCSTTHNGCIGVHKHNLTNIGYHGYYIYSIQITINCGCKLIVLLVGHYDPYHIHIFSIQTNSHYLVSFVQVKN